MAEINDIDDKPRTAIGRAEMRRTVAASGGPNSAALLLAGCVVFSIVVWMGLTRRTATVDALPRRPVGYRVDLNTADVARIRILPGVGPSLAGRIIEQRASRRFATAEDLLAVKGIGPKTLRRIEPFITQPSRVAAPQTAVDDADDEESF